MRDLLRRIIRLEYEYDEGPPEGPITIIILGGLDLTDAPVRRQILPNGTEIIGGLPDPETLQ